MLIVRLQDPCSKRSNYLHREEYLNLPKIELHHLYRALDKLAKNNELIQKQIYQTGRDLFNSNLDVVFYDVTTFYFDSEVEKEGELRQMGFGKDGKIGQTQILFSMIIDANKNPIGYKIFKGNTYEGDTFEKALEDLKENYNIDKVIVVADRGMLSKKNIALTQSKGYEFIIGERLKCLPAVVKESLIDNTQYKNQWVYTDNEGSSVIIKYTTIEYGVRTIICTYSDKRAKKDKQEREEKVERAKSLLKNPTALKAKQKRYFIKDDGNQNYELDQDKIDYNQKFDGYLAISTNTHLPADTILENYKQLYKIEHSFRTFKSHLETRPMFHWTDKRIEGHICLCYMAFTLQNFILQKVNNKGETKVTENSLRETLNKMQVSHISKGNDTLFLKSAPSPLEGTILNKLGLKPLPSISQTIPMI
jgi:transposase